MKKIFRNLTIVFTISIIIIALYWVTYDIEELFYGGGIIFDILNRLSEAFIVSYLTFLLIEYIPFNSNKKLLNSKLENNISNVASNVSSYIEYLSKILYIEFQKDLVDPNSGIIIAKSNIFHKRIDNEITVRRLPFWKNYGEKTLIFDKYKPSDAITIICGELLTSIGTSNDYQMYHDEKYLSIIRALNEMSILRMPKEMENWKDIYNFHKERQCELESLFEKYLELQNYCNNKKIIYGMK